VKAFNEPMACFHIVVMACGRICSIVFHVSCLIAVRLAGVVFLPCAFVADAACDVGVHRFARSPRVALIFQLSRWPLACTLTMGVLAYAFTSVARPARAGVCVCV
jgi:hypothetical protein